MEPSIIFDESLTPRPLQAALVWGKSLNPVTPSSGMPDFLAEAVTAARAQGTAFWPADLSGRVRNLLRHGKYKPTGRGKPASEFLLGAAAGEFPAINGPADVNNAVSLMSGYPASIFDAGKTGWELLVRRGRPGESYVFNTSGQEIQLEDLLLVCFRDNEKWQPCGNPVKDCMGTKVGPTTRDVLAIIYAPADESQGRLEAHARRFSELLAGHCGARENGFRLFPPA